MIYARPPRCACEDTEYMQYHRLRGRDRWPGQFRFAMLLMQQQDVEVSPGKLIPCLQRLPYSDLSRMRTLALCVYVKQMATSSLLLSPTIF